MTKPGDKIIFERREICPWCSKPIHTLVKRVTVRAAVAGETSIEGFIEKDKQTTLEQDYQAEQSKKKKPGRKGKA